MRPLTGEVTVTFKLGTSRTIFLEQFWKQLDDLMDYDIEIDSIYFYRDDESEAQK